MRRLLSGKALRSLAAAAIALFVIGTVAAPGTSPARGDGTTSIAVNTFENDAGAAPSVVSDLSNAAYRGVASSGRFSPRGGGPLAYEPSLTGDPFVDALRSAAKVGADDVLFGSVVQAGGGQVYYRLSLYRVAPVTFIGSQVFSQGYPPSNAQVLAAGIASNVATLAAPRQAVGTIYSTSGPLADVGSEEGFALGDRFNIMRNGQKVAEATITTITADYAQLTIVNPSPGYHPAMGDMLVGLRALPPVPPAAGYHSAFNPLGLLAAAGFALLAIGHHGQPGVPAGGSTIPPSTSPFTVQPQPVQENLPQATFPFTFSTVLSSTSITDIPAFVSFVQVNTQLPGSNATSPPQTIAAFCNCTVSFTQITGPLGNPETSMSFTATNLVAQEVIFFNFFPTITDQFGNTLSQPAFFQAGPLSIFRHRMPMTVNPHRGPVAPGPGVPSGVKPIPPKGPPANPKPGPVDPHVPH